MLAKLHNLSHKNAGRILIILIGLYLVGILSICFFKYWTFSYNGLDLAIYNQTFYNSSLGDFFKLTVHQQSYLGDHCEFLIILLLPIYLLFKSPLTLIVLQTIFIAAAAIPFYLIAKKHLSPWLAILVVFFYLANPLTWNINLYEFHFLAFVPFFIGWTFYYFDRNKFLPFALWALTSLLVREDISFIIFMFGLLAWQERKKIYWILTPLISSALYFFLAIKITSAFSVTGQYKYLIYYNWLGDSWLEIFLNFFLKFPLVLQHVFTFSNLEFILGIFLVFLFIPLLRPKYLLLSLGMFLQMILSQLPSALILNMQYSAVFITAAIITTIFSLKYLSTNLRLAKFVAEYKPVLIIIAAVGLLYNFLALGPLITFGQKIFSTDYQQVKLKQEFIRQIPAGDSLATSYDLIAPLSSRRQIYSLNYLYLGEQQFSAGQFIIPSDTQFILVNFNDFLYYQCQYANNPNLAKLGATNLQQALTGYQLIKVSNNLALWQYQAPAGYLQLSSLATEQELKSSQIKKQPLNESLSWVGWQKQNEKLSLYFTAQDQVADNYYLEINQQLYPLGFGLYPPSNWPVNQPVALNFYNLPTTQTIKIWQLNGLLALDQLGSAMPYLSEKKLIGTLQIN